MTPQRHLEQQLNTHFDQYRQALILLGARQVGKTTLLQKLFPEALYLLVDNEQVKNMLETYDISSYTQIVGSATEIIIDELHLLSNPGRAVKILYDQIPNLKLIVTGSSSLHIKNKSGESMAGRKIDYHLYPLTFSEYLVQTGVENQLHYHTLSAIFQPPEQPRIHLFDKKAILDHVLTYGLYPEMIQLPQDKRYLKNLADSVVFKDILELHLIDNKAKARELLKLLAYQVGSLVNYTELANRLNLDQRTVQRYIDIFEESYIIFRLYPYSKAERDEIGKMPKVYFYDVGLRNAIIDNFDHPSVRGDSGALFENFIIAEVKKSLSYQNLSYHMHYWRLTSGAEVDLVLSTHSELYGIEIKYQHGKMTTSFQNRYSAAKTMVMTSENFY